MHSYTIVTFSALASTVVLGDDSTYNVNAICTSDQMMRYYNANHNGLWGGSWWESGFLMGSLAELTTLDSGYDAYSDTYANTYQNAPSFNGYTSFINDYNDDEGWWAIGWVNAYDLTGNQDYLNQAITIYNDISQYKSSCGGIYWEKGQTYIASIANELYITLAAMLANRVPSDQKEGYLNSAQSIWDWFFSAGLVNSDGLVQDGVDGTTCQAEGGLFSYNQGVILSGAAELHKATGDASYLQTAGSIANAVTATNSQFTGANGIITDCNGGCDDQGTMFKGALFRGMRHLQLASPDDQWKTWIVNNAKSLWNNNLDVESVNGNSECNTGSNFNGPVYNISETSQGAALECLLAAWAVTQ